MLSKTRRKNKAHRVTARRRYSQNPAVDVFDMGWLLNFHTVSLKATYNPEDLRNICVLPTRVGVYKVDMYLNN